MRPGGGGGAGGAPLPAPPGVLPADAQIMGVLLQEAQAQIGKLRAELYGVGRVAEERRWRRGACGRAGAPRGRARREGRCALEPPARGPLPCPGL
jgi:hypothetical protein